MTPLLFKKRAGFTFLEVMIVVVMIGVLAAAAVPSLIGATDQAKVARIKSDLGTIGAAAELYYIDKGSYPATISALVDEKDGAKGYLKAVPESPDASAAYQLNTSTGEVTCTFNGNTYSSFGTQDKSSADV